ncbi:MAG: aspartate--tRNA(Asn) ligase [Chloroflexi bacterium]|nr:aspartate--tRNA(Asn) ligase [Chloroflexota bacterium]
MKTIRTIEAREHIGERVILHGWMQNLRRMGGINFLVLRDGYGTIQAVTEEESDLGEAAAAGLESVIELEGMIVSSTQAPGGIELHQPHATLITPVQATPPAPLHKKQMNANVPTLLDHAVVLNRHPQRRAIFKLSAEAMAGFRATLNGQGFTEIQTPKIVASATESGANVFKIGYFGREAYLAQSPQFYKQIMVGVFERVYEVAPVFRAEPHNTTRHLNQYVSLDVEFGFIENHFTVMGMVRQVMAGIIAHLQAQCGPELALLAARLPVVPAEIPHIHFAAAQDLILERYGVDVRGEPDLSPQDERWLGEWAQQEFGSDFLFVTGYPMSKRPFYTHADPARPQYSNSFDLLFRGLELITGGQRLHHYQDYLTALSQANLPIEPFATYLEAFKYGMPPHGGFAIGLERLLMQLLDSPNVKLTTLFPRDMQRVTP